MIPTHQQAVEIGRKGGLIGGLVKSPKKAVSSRENGKSGGRPTKAEYILETLNPVTGEWELLFDQRFGIVKVRELARDLRRDFPQLKYRYRDISKRPIM